MSISQLSADQLRRAAALKERIVKLQNQLESLLGASAERASKSASPPAAASQGESGIRRRRPMSAAARAKIAAAARARWARVRAEKKK